MAILNARIVLRVRLRAVMHRVLVRALYPAVACITVACSDRTGQTASPAGQAEVDRLAALPWDSVVAAARGTTVRWRMWRGDPAINRYVDGWVAPQLAARYGVQLEAVEGQGAELLNTLVTEREAGQTRGTASLLWINGETFAGLRRERLLAGPWSGRLPNAFAIDSASPVISRDFEQDPAGFESPWGTVQFALIYDSVRTPTPPRTVAELAEWIRQHPGRFTHDQGFTGVTWLKSVMYARGGGVGRFAGGFDSTRYAEGRDSLFAWLRPLIPQFWRRGETFPADVAAMHRLFANGEIDFTMSNNHNEVVSKVRQGVLPSTARALLLRDGTIANAHYLGIPANAPNAAGAMVVANFLLSAEAQFEKLRPEVWADGTVLRVTRLDSAWQQRFRDLARDTRAIPPDSLSRYAVPEVAPMYHERLQADWRRLVREGS